MSYSTTDPKLVSNPASLVLIAEISHTLRAQGKACATGLIPDDSEDSPIVGGIYREIPQSQVGLMDYGSFLSVADGFLDTGSDRSPWNLVSAVSLDTIFCPYNNLADSGRVGPYMPYWTDPENINEIGNSITLNPFDPFGKLLSIDPTVSGIPKTGMPIDQDIWFASGHNLSYALYYNPLDSGINGSGGYVGISGYYPSGSGSPVDFYFEKDHYARHTVERKGIRGVGFKGPMVLTGWGFDVIGNPVPSSPYDQKVLHSEASWNTHLWKSGPVDLRWDNERGVWAGADTKLFLVKFTNLYTPPSFSFEVDRSNGRDQYTRNAPQTQKIFNSGDPLYDPEYIAYTGNAGNVAYYEQLDYSNEGIEYPYYEAFIIRSTVNDPTSNAFYNIWTQDCQDCGHITEPCGGGHNSSSFKKKILIENPLRQSFDVGDLAFTVDTKRRKRVNTGNFVGGSGENAEANLYTDSSGNAFLNVTNQGSGYTTGGFAITEPGCDICTNISLIFNSGILQDGILQPSGGFPVNKNCQLTIYPNNAIIETELLPIHWVVQSEFKSQQVVTHVECDNGILQSCTMKIQTQGYKTCEWCGEETALINN
jgi:hypothetical protein